MINKYNYISKKFQHVDILRVGYHNFIKREIKDILHLQEGHNYNIRYHLPYRIYLNRLLNKTKLDIDFAMLYASQVDEFLESERKKLNEESPEDI